MGDGSDRASCIGPVPLKAGIAETRAQPGKTHNS
jgi:hypothetical protein